MNTQKMVETMTEIMKKAHAGQVDKAGAAYYLHPLAVAKRLSQQHGIMDDELGCIALGHDLFEDTDVDAQVLRDNEISERVIDGIQDLTKMPGQSRKQYQAAVLGNIDAAYVKRSDLEENMDLSRLPIVTERDLRRNENYAIFHAKVTDKIKELEAQVRSSRP